MLRKIYTRAVYNIRQIPQTGFLTFNPYGFYSQQQSHQNFKQLKQKLDRLSKISSFNDPTFTTEYYKLDQLLRHKIQEKQIEEASDIFRYKCDITMTLTGFISDVSYEVVGNYGQFLKQNNKFAEALVVFVNMELMLKKKGTPSNAEAFAKIKQKIQQVHNLMEQNQKKIKQLSQKLNNLQKTQKKISKKLQQFQALSDSVVKMAQKTKNYHIVMKENIVTVGEQWHLQPILMHSVLCNFGLKNQRNVEESLKSVINFLNAHPEVDKTSHYRGRALRSLSAIMIKKQQQNCQQLYNMIKMTEQELSKQKYSCQEWKHLKLLNSRDLAIAYDAIGDAEKFEQLSTEVVNLIESNIEKGVMDRGTAEYLFQQALIFQDENKFEEALDRLQISMEILISLFPKPGFRNLDIDFLMRKIHHKMQDFEKIVENKKQ